MPGNITDANVFTDPVNTPLDGESATGASVLDGLQDLANRTRWLKNQMDASELYHNGARYTVSGSTNGTSTKFTLSSTSGDQQSSGYSIAGDMITLPRAGVYLVSANLSLQSTIVLAGLQFLPSILSSAVAFVSTVTEIVGLGYRVSSPASDPCLATISGLIFITDPAVQKLYFACSTAGTVSVSFSAAGSNKLSISRVY